MALDSDDFDALTFDCYGTLIDWATGISAAMGPILAKHGVEIDEAELFTLYGKFEREIESGAYVKYRTVLARVVRRFGAHFNFNPTNADIERFVDSMGKWPIFSDTNGALRALSESFRLAIISNVDDDLFRKTARNFEVEFDEVITGEQVRAYKPRLAPFEAAFTRLGVAPNRILHVAQSVYHDVNPAGRMGLSCVWVQRYGKRFDPRTPSQDPVHTVPDLDTLATAFTEGAS